MSDEGLPPSESEGTDTDSEQESQEGTSGARTVEEVEAYWRNRQSGSDRAHAETERVLREQLASLQATAQVPQGGGSDKERDPRDETIAQLQKRLQEEQTTRIVETRRAKYPEAAAALADENIIAAFDEAKLAGLQAQLGTTAPPKPTPQASNRARSSGGSSQDLSLEELTSDQLRERLAQEGQGFIGSLREEGRL